MRLRTHLAVLLVMLLLALPLWGARCSTACVSMQQPAPVAVTQACMHAAGCCHRSNAGQLCSADSRSSSEALLASDVSLPDSTPSATVAMPMFVPPAIVLHAHAFASSPPGGSLLQLSIALRI